MLLLSDRHGISLSSGIVSSLKRKKPTSYGSMNIASPWKNNIESIQSFEYSDSLSYGKTKGLLTHGQVRKDKSDVFPQIELIEMLRSL